MQSLFSKVKCGHGQQISLVCVTHSCKASSPFICSNSHCHCNPLHNRCKVLRAQALQSYLVDWQQWLDKHQKEYMGKVIRLFGNLRTRLDREQQIFKDYCKDAFLGEQYSKVIYKLKKRQFASLSSCSIAAAVNKLTEPTQTLSFPSFTHKQMQVLDHTINQLFKQFEDLYNSKYNKAIPSENKGKSNQLNTSKVLMKTSSSDRLKRCNSANLSNYQSSNKSKISLGVDELMGLKVDLSFPKTINSKIIKQAGDIGRLLSRKVKKYHLVYRATQSNFRITDFYQKTNTRLKMLEQKISKYQLSTMILVRTQFGKTIGGWTSLKWNNQPINLQLSSDEEDLNPQSAHRLKSKYQPDTAATTGLFSYELMERFQLNSPHQAIYCGRKSIGFGHGDLRIVQAAHTNRKSYSKFPSSFNFNSRPYLKTSKSGMQLSGSRYSPFFKIQQWQCFIIEFA